MGKQTAFYDLHLKANAKIVNFAGWDMPLHYGSQIQEHNQVRQEAGVFDVSHMGVVDVKGANTQAFLHYLLANNIDKLVPGKALYTCMLNEQGGILDDLIVYKITDDFYRIVVNAGTRDADIAWMRKHAATFHVDITERTELVMLAIQGPSVKAKIAQFMPADSIDAILNLKPFHFLMVDDLFIARTGYTGEDGYEIIFPQTAAEKIWQDLLAAGIAPCGLGARDTLRLEAGLNLYGADMDETVTPFESNLAWTVAMQPIERNFIGRAALEKQLKAGVSRQLVGLVLAEPGVIRNHQVVKIENDGMGEVTSGSFSPTLKQSIALARLPVAEVTACTVEIRNKQVRAQIIKPPFVRNGKKMF